MYFMTIEQTVEIPANHRLTIEIPREIPAGKTQVVIQFPVRDEAHTAVPPDEKGKISSPAFREALRRSYGAWKDNPWTNHLDDVNAMRDEWELRN
jgi:preprotein translocase subunit SecA